MDHSSSYSHLPSAYLAYHGPESQPDGESVTDSPARWQEIDECILVMDAERSLNLEYPRVDWTECDTAILLDAPPKEPQHSQRTHAIICRYYDGVFPAKSEILLRYSPTYFSQLLDEKKQKRWMAKLQYKKRESASWIPKYAIDLTPSGEGDEATQLLMHLYCPEVVALWHVSRIRFKCPNELVGGVDEFSKSIMPGVMKDNDEPLDLDESLPVVPRYSQLRHHRAIERLILILHGKVVDLDSAVKLYTTCAVSHHFQVVAGSPLQGMVTTWIYHPQNKFLQIAPEACLRIADWIQEPTIATDAFAILVGEESQDGACWSSGSPRTRYERKREDLDETWQTRIQYARESFEQRISICFESLAEESMQWIEALPEVRKLVSIRNQLQATGSNASVLYAVRARIDGLKKLVRRCIHICLCSRMVFAEREHVNPSLGSETLHPDVNFVTAWNSMPWKSRIFTSTFWKLLGTMNLELLANHRLSSRRRVTAGQPTELAFVTHTPDARLAFREAAIETDPLRGPSLPTSNPAPRVSWIDDSLRGDLVVEQTQTDRLHFSALEEAMEEIPCFHGELVFRPQPVSELHAVHPDNSWSRQPLVEERDEAKHAPFTRMLPFRSAIAPSAHPTDIEQFYREVERELKHKAFSMLEGPAGSSIDANSVRLMDILVCLEDDEIQCLPLWAGGCDDGTGGVFSATVASSEERFEGGRNFAKGGEEDEFDTMTVTNSEVPTSLLARDGFSEVMDRRQVYPMSEADSEESFGIVDGPSVAGMDLDENDDVESVRSDTPTLRNVGMQDDFTDIFMSTGDSDKDDEDDTDEEFDEV